MSIKPKKIEDVVLKGEEEEFVLGKLVFAYFS
jgi:hypothetical protein